jgi:hypothetical protein
MKRLKSFFAALLVLASINLHAQTVDEIITKHIDALGGKEKLAALKSIITESEMEIMGNSSVVTETLLEGKGYKSETDFNGSKVVQCVTDKGGWALNPLMGVATAQPIPEELYPASKPSIYFEGALLNYAAKGYTATLEGTEDNSFKIKIGGPVEIYYFIDTKTFNLVKVLTKSEMMGQPVDVIITYSDFKKTDSGLVMPFTKDVNMGMFQFTQKTSKMDINKEINPVVFDMPQ